MSSRTVWLLKKGSERKFRFGHPWVFSSELAQSPKSVEAGGLVELRDINGTFLAIGYGHPNSMISFRTLSLDPNVTIDAKFFCDKITRAHRIRQITGVDRESHRLIFGEGDYLPGLIIDRFAFAKPVGTQVFVIQTSTAGMNRLLPEILEGLKLFVFEQGEWSKTAVVIANDSKSRVAEGLESEPKRVEKSLEAVDFNAADILIQAPLEGMKPTTMTVDFVGGQKTGFFLDQRSNVQLAAREVARLAEQATKEKRTFKILDLFCYVGQWGTQLAHVAREAGADVEVTLVDASAKALELASKNVERLDAKAVVDKRDVVESLARLERGTYDVVICDPPAFVKKKKDLPPGAQAYTKVNREAIRRTRPGGLFVTCSCSGLFDEAEFRAMLSRVTASFDRPVRWIARGSHGPDHPQRPEFPQGTYLKSWLGLLD